jgi:hypothetical protein
VDAPPGSLQFEGPVQCFAQPRAGDWRLRGRLRSVAAGRPAAPAELLLSGVRSASAQALPARLYELRVSTTESSEAALLQGRRAHELRLEAREGRFTLQVEALRVHHDVSQSFYHALPRIALPRLTRAAWAALLTLLRVPLVSRLLK